MVNVTALAVAVTAALLFATPLSAQGKSAEEQQQEADFLRASGVCQASVKSGARGRMPGRTTFKAQADADGTVNTLGTDHARFEYERCMSQQGHPLRPR